VVETVETGVLITPTVSCGVDVEVGDRTFFISEGRGGESSFKNEDNGIKFLTTSSIPSSGSISPRIICLQTVVCNTSTITIQNINSNCNLPPGVKCGDGYVVVAPSSSSTGGGSSSSSSNDGVSSSSSISVSNVSIDGEFHKIQGNVTITCSKFGHVYCYANPAEAIDIKCANTYSHATEDDPAYFKQCGSNNQGGSITDCVVPDGKNVYCKLKD